MEQNKYFPTAKIQPPLDEEFRPAVLAHAAFEQVVRASGLAQELVIGVERVDGAFSRFETVVFPDDHPDAEYNLFFIERIVKFLLWQRGGWKVTIGGSKQVGEYLQKLYAPDGRQSFDYHFMGNVYDQTFEVEICEAGEVPAEHELQKALGRNLNGNRIGFDLGASDLKVSAVVEGDAIFSTEIEWQPVEQTDPNYHREYIKNALNLAAGKMPHVDAIGGSSAGVYVHNRPMVASLFRGIPQERFGAIRNMFLELQQEMGVPLEIVNDGEVTALAGSMSLEADSVLGIAMGSSEATGYITPKGNITDWLNELAFAPVDYQAEGPVDEWSGDRGVGALYFSQQCVFRLAPKLGIEIPSELTNAQKLAFVQEYLEAGKNDAHLIWESMGIYLGYTLAHYARFYAVKHVLLLGRCTSGKGGPIMLEHAKQVLEAEFPELAQQLHIQLPDEKSRRVGQSIAAASLPAID